jgi:hypothetical protein
MTRRVIARWSVIALVAVAACGPVLRRGNRTPTTPAGAPTAKDSTVAVAPPAPPDSAKKPDTDSTKVAAADSAEAKPAAEDSARGKKKAAPKKTAKSTSRPCVLDFSESPPESRVLALKQASGAYHTFIGGGVAARCQGEPALIRSDSAEHFETTGILYLIGNVKYDEPNKLQFTSRRATYYTREERLIGDSAVTATQLKSGSSLYGMQIEYLRAVPGKREASKLIAPMRPTVRLEERDKGANAGPPVIIMANTFVDDADSLLFAVGDVDINRAEINARSDSGAFDKGNSRSRLIRNASIVSRDQKQPYRLTADTIDLFNTERTLDRVYATSNGRVTNKDILLTGERIDMRLTDSKLDRAFAWGGKRAKATTPEQEVESDSLYIEMPGQRVREIHAIGRATATGTPDTLRIRTKDRDIMRGDTILASFDSLTTPGDTTNRPRIRQVLSVGNATSLYHVATNKGRNGPPALNYVRGATITVAFDSGQVRVVDVDSAASGAYLEPNDSTMLDTLAVDSLGKPKPAPTPQPTRSPTPPPPGGRPPMLGRREDRRPAYPTTQWVSDVAIPTDRLSRRRR